MIKYILTCILLMSFATAGVQLCIDTTAPSPPSNLSVSGKVGSIILNWEPSTDEPSCSGIEFYIISREAKQIGMVTSTTLKFTDDATLAVGNYTYTVFAIDKVGHNTGSAIKNIVTVEEGGVVTSRGGGGNSNGLGSSVCVENWNCSGWSDCVGNVQRRICEDLEKCGTIKNKPLEFQECGLPEKDNTTILESTSTENKGFFSTITGGVIGVLGPVGTAASGIIILTLAGSFAFVSLRKRKTRR
jgi:hypothetical protein